jgi:hypothetical protein
MYGSVSRSIKEKFRINDYLITREIALNRGVWLMADYDRDGIPDLVFIKTSNTGTGRIEVHIASGAAV